MGDNVRNNLRSGKQATEMQRLGSTYLARVGPRQHPKKRLLVPFAIGRELIVDVPINPHGFAYMYINDTTGLTVDLPGTLNADIKQRFLLQSKSQPGQTTSMSQSPASQW